MAKGCVYINQDTLIQIAILAVYKSSLLQTAETAQIKVVSLTVASM